MVLSKLYLQRKRQGHCRKGSSREQDCEANITDEVKRWGSVAKFIKQLGKATKIYKRIQPGLEITVEKHERMNLEGKFR